jgi:hypothetical protein
VNDIDSIVAQLERQQAAIEKALSALREVNSTGVTRSAAQGHNEPSRKRRLTPAGRKRIAAAARKRWADKRAAEAAGSSTGVKGRRVKRGISAAGRKRLAEAMRRRWTAKRTARAAG